MPAVGCEFDSLQAAPSYEPRHAAHELAAPFENDQTPGSLTDEQVASPHQRASLRLAPLHLRAQIRVADRIAITGGHRDGRADRKRRAEDEQDQLGTR